MIKAKKQFWFSLSFFLLSVFSFFLLVSKAGLIAFLLFVLKNLFIFIGFEYAKQQSAGLKIQFDGVDKIIIKYLKLKNFWFLNLFLLTFSISLFTLVFPFFIDPRLIDIISHGSGILTKEEQLAIISSLRNALLFIFIVEFELFWAMIPLVVIFSDKNFWQIMSMSLLAFVKNFLFVSALLFSLLMVMFSIIVVSSVLSYLSIYLSLITAFILLALFLPYAVLIVFRSVRYIFLPQT